MNLLGLFSRDERDHFLSYIEALLPEGDFFYLGGPMSNLPAFNFPAFDEAAAYLRSKDYVVASPAEFDHEQARQACLESPDGQNIGSLWEDALARDLCVIAHPRCVGVILIEGWENSQGADLETYNAARLGKPINELIDGELWLVADREQRQKELRALPD